MFGFLLLLLVSLIVVIFSLLQRIFFEGSENIFFLHFLFLLLIPVWYLGHRYIQNEKDEASYRVTKISLFLSVGMILFLGILSYFFDPTIADISIIFALLIGVFFSVSSRYLFLLALCLLIVLAIVTSLGEREMSEILALYTYYALLAGVAVEILQPLWMRLSGKISSKMKELEWWDDYVEEFQWYMEWIVRSIPIVFIVIVLQYFLEGYIPITFRPTLTGLGLIVSALFIAITFAPKRIFHLHTGLGLFEGLSILAGLGLMWLSFGEGFESRTLYFQIAIVLIYVLSLIFIYLRRHTINTYLEKISH